MVVREDFYDALPGVEGIAAITKTIKQDTVIETYIEQGNLTEIERAIYLLHNGSNIYKMSVFDNLRNIVKDASNSEITKLLREIGESIWKFDEEVQLQSSEGVAKLLPCLANSHLIEVSNMLKTMIGLRNEHVRERWKPLFVSIIQYLPEQIILDEVRKMALEKAELSESVESRQFACKMFGVIVVRLNSQQIESIFLNKAIQLCQDTDFSVRATMCDQLNTIAWRLGAEKTTKVILKEVFELLYDEEREVAKSAITCLSNLLELVDENTRKNTILPVFKQLIVTFMHSNQVNNVYEVLLSLFGKYVWFLSGDITSDEDWALLCNFFKSSYQKNDINLKFNLPYHCAYNFPAMVKSMGVKRFSTHLVPIFKSMCDDTLVQVRRAIAAGFHEVAIILGEKSMSVMKDSLLRLAKDDKLEVLDAIYSNFNVILQQFNLCTTDDKAAYFSQLVDCILAYEQLISKNWRKVNTLLSHFKPFHEYFANDIIYEKFIPVLLRYLVNGTNDTKQICAELIVHFIRKLNNNLQQVELINKLILEFGKNKSYYQRLTYCALCDCFLQSFSRKFFREKMLECVIDFTKDNISNIRRRVCLLLPAVRRCLVDPSQITCFDEVLLALQADPDSDVVEAAREATRIITVTDASNNEKDIIDQRREEFELALLEVSHDQDKLNRRKQLRELLNGDPATVTASNKNKLQPKKTVPQYKSKPAVTATQPGLHKPSSVNSLPLTERSPKDVASSLPSPVRERRGSFGTEQHPKVRKNSLGSGALLPSLTTKGKKSYSKG